MSQVKCEVGTCVSVKIGNVTCLKTMSQEIQQAFTTVPLYEGVVVNFIEVGCKDFQKREIISSPVKWFYLVFDSFRVFRFYKQLVTVASYLACV